MNQGTGLTRTRDSLLPQAAVLIVLIALADWKVDNRVPLGWVYLVPCAMAARTLGRAGLVALAILCTGLAEAFDGFVWQVRSGLPREVLYFSAFAGMGLFVHQTLLGREASARHMAELEGEIGARREAEEQLKILIESTPVAVFTADASGTVLLANEAAARLFALAPGELIGRSLSEFIPPLLDVPALRDGGRPAFRTVMQCRGRRATGEIFQADVWFSTYQTSTGPRLAALVADTSDELRNREEASLDQLLAGSRIVFGAVSHEVRNVCAAIHVVYENLARTHSRGAGGDAPTDAGVDAWDHAAAGAAGSSLTTSRDFEALGTLVLALERIASAELSQAANQLTFVDLFSLLEEVLIIISPALREMEIGLEWRVAPELPRVWADRQSLLQVLLNLVKNSERAMENTDVRILTLEARQAPGAGAAARVEIRIVDTGSGVGHPELLFKPFQQQASATGLGLYLSRALMRSFSGELRYEGPAGNGQGACFVVELVAMSARQSMHEEILPGRRA